MTWISAKAWASQISNNYIIRSPGVAKDEHQQSYRNEYDRSKIETSEYLGYTNTNRIPQKVKATGHGYNMINPKYREKEVKIVQAYWGEGKRKYKNILGLIVNIKSVWRGKFTRKFIYDKIVMSYLHQKFLDIMSKTLVNHVRPQLGDVSYWWNYRS